MCSKNKMHYVPQLYLRKFLLDGSRHLYVYNKLTNTEYKSPTKDVCEENRLYTLSEKEIDYLKIILDEKIDSEYIETSFFDEQIENKFERILNLYIKNVIECYKKEKSKVNLQFDDRLTFSKYLLIQFLRTPTSLEQHNGLVKAIRNNPSHPHHDLYKLNPQFSDFLEKEQHRGLDVSMLCDFPNIGILQKIMWEIASWKWVYLYSPEPAFCTSDTPVAFFHHPTGEILHKAVLQEGVEIVFPLSNRVALCIFEPHYFRDIIDSLVAEANKDFVAKVNALMFISAKREVVSSTPGIIKYSITK